MKAKIPLNPTSTLVSLLIFHNLIWVSFCSDHDPIALKGIDVGHPFIDVTPVPIHSTSQGSKVIEFCKRVPVHGVSRIKLQNYAKAYRVMVFPSVVIPDKWHSKIHICFHQNASLGLCQCEQDGWKSVHTGSWSSTMSTYEQRFIDVKFVDGVSGSVTVILHEVSQGWRYVLLAVGTTLLFLAPVVSEWVPFYFITSMAIGDFAVVLILHYQEIKLLPTGRKSALYLSMYTSLLGAGSFLVHYVAAFVNSILSNFGFSQEMQKPLGAGSFLVHYVAAFVNSILSNFGFSQEMQKLVWVFLLLLSILLGAGLCYWLARKYVLSEDGELEVGVSQFIKWAMQVIAVTCIFLSSIDTPLASTALVTCASTALITCLTLHYILTSIKRQDHQSPSLNMPKLWQWSGQRTPKVGRAEFLSEPKNVSPFGNQWNAPRNSFAWSDSPVKGTLNTSWDRGSTGSQDDFYSTFHTTPNKKRFSKKEWMEFTEESTRNSVNELTSTREFSEWLIQNANRIKLLPDNGDFGRSNYLFCNFFRSILVWEF